MHDNDSARRLKENNRKYPSNPVYIYGRHVRQEKIGWRTKSESEVENVPSSATAGGQRAKPSAEKRVAGKSLKYQTSESFLIGG